MPPSPSLEARRRSVPASCSSLLPSVVLPCGARHHFYFAIGSMCNPVSLLLRGIQPVSGCSAAAVLRGYRLAFHGEAGMADIQPAPSCDSADIEASAASGSPYVDHFHGVLHLISEAHLAVLDRIEAGYRRIVVRVQLYDGSTQAAFVYQMYDTPQLQRHGLPSERYVDIISRGCQHYNVCSQYVRWLQSLPCVPRPQPSQLLALSLPVQPRLFSLSELALCDGEDGRELCIAVNGKVLQYVGEPDEPLPSSCCQSTSPASFSAYAHMKAEYAGRDVTYLLSLMCYEPLFPVASCAAELSQHHRARIEDMYSRKLACLASFSFEVVGALVDEPPPTTAAVQSHWQQDSSESVELSMSVSRELPTSPRGGTVSAVLLNGRRIDEFKARRRRGSLTSTILQNVQRIIHMQTRFNHTGDSSESDGEEQPHYERGSRSDTQERLPYDAPMRAVFAELKCLSHSPVSGLSVASSTATTIASLLDFDPHSPLRSPLSLADDGTDHDQDDLLHHNWDDKAARH